MNREAWLTQVAKLVEPVFSKFEIKPYRVSCGWPCRGGINPKRRVLGECHHQKSSGTGTHEIFISPYLAKPIEVAGVICHELAHVAAGIEAAHGKQFITVCRYVGLTNGKPTQVMPGDSLNDRLSKIISGLGEYPHSKLEPVPKLTKVSVSSLSIECLECGCRALMSVKWLESVGLPTCACGAEFTII